MEIFNALDSLVDMYLVLHNASFDYTLYIKNINSDAVSTFVKSYIHWILKHLSLSLSVCEWIYTNAFAIPLQLTYNILPI